VNRYQQSLLERALDAAEDQDPDFAAELLRQVLAYRPVTAVDHRCVQCGRWPGQKHECPLCLVEVPDAA
jgi:hypothetical protein